jgi:hypothetical protein
MMKTRMRTIKMIEPGLADKRTRIRSDREMGRKC